MKAKRKLKKYITKGIRKIRHRKGFGVHSPFAYSLITQVINEQTPFYAYEQILRLKKKYASSHRFLPGFASRTKPSTKILFLLYRLVNRFNPETILEVGNSGGLITYALGLANTKSEVLSICPDAVKIEQARNLFEHEAPHEAHFIHSPYLAALANLPVGYQADFVYVHASSTFQWESLHSHLCKQIHTQTVIVIEGIKTEISARKLWNCFRVDPEARITMDLYDIGLVIYNNKLYKQHFIVSF